MEYSLFVDPEYVCFDPEYVLSIFFLPLSLKKIPSISITDNGQPQSLGK